MALKKIRFPLEMENGAEVRTLEELKEHFSMEKVLLYYSDGRLLKWLRNNYLDEEAEVVSELDPKDPELNKKICEIFDVEYNESVKVDIEKITVNNQRIARLKEYISDDKFNGVIDRIAFDQNELGELLNKGLREIYLCGDRFVIPLDKENICYIGVNRPVAVINSSEKIDFNARNISFLNIKVDEANSEHTKNTVEFFGSADEWVEPKLEKCRVCCKGEDIPNMINKYKQLGYVHYSMYLTDFIYDKNYGAQSYDKERRNYVSYENMLDFEEKNIFRNVISMIADNLKYIKNLVGLSREKLTSINMNRLDDRQAHYIKVEDFIKPSGSDRRQTNIADYIKYSGLMLFNFNKNDILKYNDNVHRLGILVPGKVNEKIVSKGIKKTFTDNYYCHDYHCTGYILPFDDIKEILLSKDTVLLSEDCGVKGNRSHCIDGCELFRDEVTYNPWIIDSYDEKIDGSKIMDDYEVKKTYKSRFKEMANKYIEFAVGDFFDDD